MIPSYLCGARAQLIEALGRITNSGWLHLGHVGHVVLLIGSVLLPLQSGRETFGNMVSASPLPLPLAGHISLEVPAANDHGGVALLVHEADLDMRGCHRDLFHELPPTCSLSFSLAGLALFLVSSSFCMWAKILFLLGLCLPSSTPAFPLSLGSSGLS